jgi:hypothetical protein
MTTRVFRRAVCLALAGALCVALAARAEIIDRILAVVDSQPITLSDVNAVRLLGLVPGDASAADPIASRLDRLIERTLIVTEVDRYQPPEPATAEIERRLQAVETRAGGPDALARTLAVTAFTPERLRQWVRDDLRIDTYLNQRFGTSDPAARERLVSDWVRGLRRRSEITVLYLGQ